MIKKYPLISALFVGLAVLAVTVVARADGQAIYAQHCVVCHGEQAQGIQALSTPQLAGQQSSYLQRQLKHFQSGLRGTAEGDNNGRQMLPIAARLDPESIVSVADYLSGLPATRVAQQGNGDVREGNKLYQAYCGSCHGTNAMGNEALNAPNLTLLSGDYLTAQYLKFLNGQRGYERSDRYGRMMKMMAGAMPERAQLDAVVAYVQSLSVAEQ